MRRRPEDHSEIKEGMKLRCVSENYEGDVRNINGVLQSDCGGFGYEPISNYDIDDLILIDADESVCSSGGSSAGQKCPGNGGDGVRCCSKAGIYNGFASGPLLFVCQKSCTCHD